MTVAMRTGNRMAGSFVVEAYQHGRGTAESVTLARQNARVCATMGNANCQTILAQYLEAGTAGKIDSEGARIQYERAALQENTLAMWKLAEMYDKAKGIARNDALASYWYRTAHANGSPTATAILKARGLLEVDPKVKSYLDHIDKDGPDRSSIHAFTYEVAVYCKWGGKRCHELEVEAYRFQKQQNAMAESANMARLWNVYAAHSSGSSDTEWRGRSDCMRKKTESMERQLYGKQDWAYAGKC